MAGSFAALRKIKKGPGLQTGTLITKHKLKVILQIALLW